MISDTSRPKQMDVLWDRYVAQYFDEAALRGIPVSMQEGIRKLARGAYETGFRFGRMTA